MKNEQAVCIYLQRLDGTKNEIIVSNKYVAGIPILDMRQFVIDKPQRGRLKNVDKTDCNNKKLSRVLKKYYNQEIGVIANERILRELKLSNVLFEARKQELFHNLQRVFDYFQKYREVQISRTQCMLILDSFSWKQTEIVDVLLEMKNYYADIFVVAKRTVAKIEQLVEFFFDEYGVVLHILSDAMAKQTMIETAFLFVEDWDNSVKEYRFKTGYVVAEWENDMKRHGKRNTNGREMYSGFLYENENGIIPYEIAIAFLNSTQMRKKMIDMGCDFPISIVAISGVE